MYSVEDTLFRLLRIGLEVDPAADIDAASTDWHALHDLAVSQGLSAVVWSALNDTKTIGISAMPRELKMAWAYEAEAIANKCRCQRRLAGRLAAFYAGHGIRTMLLKGYGLGLCYPSFELRPCGDIDIWLFGKQKQADAAMRTEKNVAISEDEHHHTTFVINNILVENHFDFLNVHSHRSNRDLERLLQSLAVEGCERYEIDAAAIFVPSPDFNALFLLRHTAAHFAASHIGLRHVADWAMFVRRYCGRIDWDSLERIARKHNMHRFLHCMNAFAIDLVGLSSDIFPVFEREPELERRVLNDILHPEFSEKMPRGGVAARWSFMLRRWWHNRWKHSIVYKDGVLGTFFVQIYSHLLRPKSLFG